MAPQENPEELKNYNKTDIKEYYNINFKPIKKDFHELTKIIDVFFMEHSYIIPILIYLLIY